MRALLQNSATFNIVNASLSLTLDPFLPALSPLAAGSIFCVLLTFSTPPFDFCWWPPRPCALVGSLCPLWSAFTFTHTSSPLSAFAAVSAIFNNFFVRNFCLLFSNDFPVPLSVAFFYFLLLIGILVDLVAVVVAAAVAVVGVAYFFILGARWENTKALHFYAIVAFFLGHTRMSYGLCLCLCLWNSVCVLVNAFLYTSHSLPSLRFYQENEKVALVCLLLIGPASIAPSHTLCLALRPPSYSATMTTAETFLF